MIEILSLLVPVFAIIALGWAAVIYGLLDALAVKSLNDFALWVALPALLFRSVAESKSLHLMDVSAVYFASCLLVYISAGVVARSLLGRPFGEAAVFALNATYGNIIYLGTPIISVTFGPPGVVVLVGIIVLHSGILLPLTSILLELSEHNGKEIRAVFGNTAKGLLRNPIMMSILLGLVWHEFAIPTPAGVYAFLSILGSAATPLALFCVGASLPHLGRDRLPQAAILPILVKLFILPSVVAGMAIAAGITGLPLAVAIIAAAMPTGANALLLSRRVVGFGHTSASTVMATTVISVATLATLIGWVG